MQYVLNKFEILFKHKFMLVCHFKIAKNLTVICLTTFLKLKKKHFNLNSWLLLLSINRNWNKRWWWRRWIIMCNKVEYITIIIKSHICRWISIDFCCRLQMTFKLFSIRATVTDDTKTKDEEKKRTEIGTRGVWWN